MGLVVASRSDELSNREFPEKRIAARLFSIQAVSSRIRHAEKQTLFDLLNAEKNAAIKLTESFAMHPGASVSGLYFSHPEAKYFGVGKIGHVLFCRQR